MIICNELKIILAVLILAAFGRSEIKKQLGGVDGEPHGQLARSRKVGISCSQLGAVECGRAAPVLAKCKKTEVALFVAGASQPCHRGRGAPDLRCSGRFVVRLGCVGCALVVRWLAHRGTSLGIAPVPS